jgi:hypothetical protein
MVHFFWLAIHDTQPVAYPQQRVCSPMWYPEQIIYRRTFGFARHRTLSDYSHPSVLTTAATSVRT